MSRIFNFVSQGRLALLAFVLAAPSMTNAGEPVKLAPPSGEASYSVPEEHIVTVVVRGEKVRIDARVSRVSLLRIGLLSPVRDAIQRCEEIDAVTTQLRAAVKAQKKSPETFRSLKEWSKKEMGRVASPIESDGTCGSGKISTARECVESLLDDRWTMNSLSWRGDMRERLELLPPFIDGTIPEETVRTCLLDGPRRLWCKWRSGPRGIVCSAWM